MPSLTYYLIFTGIELSELEQQEPGLGVGTSKYIYIIFYHCTIFLSPSKCTCAPQQVWYKLPLYPLYRNRDIRLSWGLVLTSTELSLCSLSKYAYVAQPIFGVYSFHVTHAEKETKKIKGRKKQATKRNKKANGRVQV